MCAWRRRRWRACCARAARSSSSTRCSWATARASTTCGANLIYQHTYLDACCLVMCRSRPVPFHRRTQSIGKFGDFNEPHYRTYIETDLGALFRAGGLVPWRKELASSSKGLAFKKPEAGAAVPAGTAPAAAAHAL